ncbi:decapping nuclease DXO homolog [Pieris napi]|uniref:decapping nuclease DXO homolog n=1 Tax=Pieris napi TaxID=78633 RepID=UPI001FBABDD9|nr:decapping nuclease DXO homolog [Pieris napi]
MNSQPELLTNPSIYAKNFPKFGRPEIIGYIGLENLKYARKISNTTVNFDLNLLVEEAQRKPPEHDVKLNDLIQFLSNNEKRLNLRTPNKLDSATIFCYRGLMTCVANSPYENDPWIIVALLFKGNIYLCARDTEVKKLQKKIMNERDKLFTSWGFKFEQYILSDKPHVKPNPNVPNNEMEEFSCVFKTTLNSHKIIYGAEMDGIRCDKKEVPEAPKTVDDVLHYLQDKEFIELKTNRHLEFPHQQRSYRRYKTRKWWCQSFLVGIDTILCGFRNDNGIVENLQTINVKDLPKMSKEYWDPNVCFNFLDTFFVYVKRCFNREMRRKYGDKDLDLKSVPLMSLMFELVPNKCVQCINYTHEDDPILPDWFLTTFGKHQEI